MDKHPRRMVFLLSIFPNPLTTFTTITASSSGIWFESFFMAALAGFLVWTTLLAVAGQGILIALGLSS